MTSPPGGFQADRVLKAGVIWNLGAFALIGISGIAMNILVATLYPAWVLGAFNQVLAYYIVGGQIATFAIHYSVLYNVSIAASDPRRSGEAALTGLLLAALTSLALCAALWLCKGFIVRSDAVVAGLDAALGGLFLFPLNKILMATLNALRHMRVYAVANASRYVLIVVAIPAGAYAGIAPERVALCLTIAESVLFVGLLIATAAHLRIPTLTAAAAWVRTHLAFGARGVAGGLLVELNTRVDVLVLGFFTTDATVGIYSIASIFAEGMYQLLLILRINYDPMLARLIAEGKSAELRALIVSGKKLAYGAMAVAGVLAVVAYPFVLQILIGKPEFAASWPVFAILVAGLMLSAGFVPFGGILQQGGHPLAQSLLFATVVALNLAGNVMLVPYYGAVGAAVATAVAQACFPLVLNFFARSYLKLPV
jgi:O-antigen/teichoic acid export membrane protein